MSGSPAVSTAQNTVGSRRQRKTGTGVKHNGLTHAQSVWDAWHLPVSTPLDPKESLHRRTSLGSPSLQHVACPERGKGKHRDSSQNAVEI